MSLNLCPRFRFDLPLKVQTLSLLPRLCVRHSFHKVSSYIPVQSSLKFMCKNSRDSLEAQHRRTLLTLTRCVTYLSVL